MREHDDGGGRPQVRPESLDLEVETEPQPNPTQTKETLFTEPDSEFKSGKWNNPLASGGFLSLVLLIVGFMSLWILSQLVQFSRDLMTWPLVLRYPALGILALLLGYIFYHSAKLWNSFKQLRTHRQLSLKDLDEMEERKQLQEQSYREHLSKYLKQYHFKDRELRKQLCQLGFHDLELEKLEQNQKRLIEGEWADSASWLSFYRENFQTEIDRVANERIRKTSLRIGIASASCPQKALDLLIVLGGSLQLNADLCIIYQLKLGKVGLIGLLIQAFRNSFIAMNLEDVSDHLIDQWTDQWTEHASGLASNLAKIVGTRLAEGGANALLLNRLGQSTKRQLQPLKI